MNQVEKMQRTTTQKIQERQKTIEELKQVVNTLKNLSVSSESEESYSMTVDHILFDGLRKSLSDLKQHFEDLYQEEISNIFSVVARIQILPLTRNHFKHSVSESNQTKYTVQINLNIVFGQ
ncbi:hypothetical protein G5714_019589 [Onychostoma macrolepis]|uniref:Uncharacterized protein n=1 Tax=Onychostoma macrolepis TaxID=369639 RepID=A0A7J6BYA4_9TELE|nr:hypothetical protein G5714_019589 [Onychostoma macrolepis]